MNYKNSLIFLFIILFVLFLIPLFTHTQKDTTKPTIVCTTSIIADAVNHIVGDTIPVISLMGPGIDPHLYRARESDIRKLAHAAIIFYNGLHLEGRMAHVLEKMNGYTKAVAVADALEPYQRLASSQFSTNYDPHIWLDVSLWIPVVHLITQTVCAQFPKQAAVYLDNEKKYCAHLLELEKYVRSRISQIPENARILVTAHDAFGYFGKAYGFKVIGLQGMSTQTEAGLGDIAHLVNFIVTHKIPALFSESSIPIQSINAVQQAARAQGQQVIVGPTLYTDALGIAGSGADTYISMIRHNVDAIVDALLKKP